MTYKLTRRFHCEVPSGQHLVSRLHQDWQRFANILQNIETHRNIRNGLLHNRRKASSELSAEREISHLDMCPFFYAGSVAHGNVPSAFAIQDNSLPSLHTHISPHTQVNAKSYKGEFGGKGTGMGCSWGNSEKSYRISGDHLPSWEHDCSLTFTALHFATSKGI